MTGIFLTGYQPLPDMIHVNKKHFPYTKNPAKLKTILEVLLFLVWQSRPPNTIFLFGGIPLTSGTI